MLGSLQIVPDRLLKLACVCGEQLANGEDLWAYRRAMSRTQVLEDVCINATIHCAQKGFAAYWCGDVLCRHHEGFSWTHRRCQLGLFLRFLDHFVVPCAGVTLGHALGGLMRPHFAELDHGSGIVYNMAWSCEFLMTNLWLAFRVSTLPRLLRRVAPHLAEVCLSLRVHAPFSLAPPPPCSTFCGLAQPDVVLMAAEFDRLTMLSAVAFEGKTPEQLVRIRLELSKAVRGDPTTNLVLGGHRRPTQTEALELLDVCHVCVSPARVCVCAPYFARQITNNNSVWIGTSRGSEGLSTGFTRTPPCLRRTTHVALTSAASASWTSRPRLPCGS